jgi:hypothetical protein
MKLKINVLDGSDTVAQLAHVGWGMGLVLLLALAISWHHAAGVVACFALAKEVAEAEGWAFWEPKQSWASSRRDFYFWCGGIVIAAAALVLRAIITAI